MRYRGTLIAALCVLAGLGAFVATVGSAERRGEGQGEPTRRNGRGPLRRWLQLTPEQTKAVDEADPEFADESRALIEALGKEREKLARLLENTASSDDDIRAQVERVIAAHNTLERRVARHVLAIRKHLRPRQQKQLMGLCAAGVRRAAGWCWRRGRGDGTGRGQGSGRGKGRGGWGGGGRGQGGEGRGRAGG